MVSTPISTVDKDTLCDCRFVIEVLSTLPVLILTTVKLPLSPNNFVIDALVTLAFVHVRRVMVDISTVVFVMQHNTKQDPMVLYRNPVVIVVKVIVTVQSVLCGICSIQRRARRILSDHARERIVSE